MSTNPLKLLFLCTLNNSEPFELIDDKFISQFTKISNTEKNYTSYVYSLFLFKYNKSRNNVENIKNQLSEFKKIEENTFITKEIFDSICEIYSSLKKLYNSFNKLAKIWKWKRAKVYNTEDLYMNPIKEGQKNTITIMKNNTKYIFALKELISNFNRELSNICNSFVEPLPCKNMYTNECFSKSELYNIYFAIRNSTFVMPILIHYYYLSNFCLSEFTNLNENIIKESYIDKYVNNITNDILMFCVNNMFKEHQIKNIKIHKNFPINTLKELLEPYLKLYYISKLSKNKWKKANAFIKLHSMLHKLQIQSPSFGRKKYIPTKKYIFGNMSNIDENMKYYFNMKMPTINQITLHEFMQNHLDLNIKINSHLMVNYQSLLTQLYEEILSRRLPSRYAIEMPHEDEDEDDDDSESEQNSDFENEEETE